MTSSIQRDEIERFVDTTARYLEQASFSAANGKGLLATTADGKYPLVFTRDLALALARLCELDGEEIAEPYARFLLDLQEDGGTWAESYTPEGQVAGEHRSEDVSALAFWAILSYVRASDDGIVKEQARRAVERATEYTLDRTLNPYIYLVETTRSIHGGTVSEGYELWNNCAHAAAFALAHRIYGGERYRRLALLIRRSISQLMTHETRFLRRLDASGYPDPRPDMVLMAPYYFGLWSAFERAVINSAELIERTLWNVEIGGYVRFLPFSAVEREVLPGPWPRYTAWMAQYHYEFGNRDRAEVILRWLFDNLEGGALPEVLIPSSSAHRYLSERRRALRRMEAEHAAGGSVADQVYEGMLRDVEQVEQMATERPVIPSGAPHLWAHMEVLRALKRGGHIERWEMKPAVRRGLTEP